jgi:hypothetical protein
MLTATATGVRGVTIAVIGAGFGRTGTLSLKAALEELGIGPCYHMTEMFERPTHAAIWECAAHGERVDWSELFRGYRAAVDWPAAAFYRELMDTYPEAKVILTVRDPDRWYDSARSTIYDMGRVASGPVFQALARVVPRVRQAKGLGRVANAVVWERTFDGNFDDRQYAIDAFKRWNEQVKAHVPADQLLVYEVKDGWEPLCRFLDVDVPDGKPFPHLNDTAEFRKRIRMMRAVSIAVPLVGALAAGALVRGVAKRRSAGRAASRR